MSNKEETLEEHLCQVESYEDGELIFSEGTVSGWVYVVAFGEVEIYRMVNGKKIIIDRIHKGESLGEMSFFDQNTRSASARAVGMVGLMQFKDNFLLEEFGKLPVPFQVLLEAMALRMRTLMEKITLLASKPQILEVINEESSLEGRKTQ